MLGILSVLLLLIPSLLLLGQLTRYAQININTPLFSAGGSPNDGVIRCGRELTMHIAVGHDGFFVREGSNQWRRVGSPSGGHDHDALTAVLREHKRSWPGQSIAYVTAQDEVPLEMLVATLDTVRGRDCRLTEVWQGQGPPPECLLWRPILEHTPVNRPKAKRLGGISGPLWPPAPPREVTSTEGA